MKDLIYMDNGATSYPKPEEVYTFMDAFYREFGVNPGRSGYALNLIIFGMLKKGDHAITTTLEHNAVLRPLYHLYQDYGVEVDHVPFDGKGFVDPEAFKKKFSVSFPIIIWIGCCIVSGGESR